MRVIVNGIQDEEEEDDAGIDDDDDENKEDDKGSIDRGVDSEFVEVELGAMTFLSCVAVSSIMMGGADF